MIVAPGSTWVVEFTTSSPFTQAATDATGTPVGVLTLNGVDNSEAVTVTNRATGRYSASVTIPAGASFGDEVALAVTATVAGVAGGGIVAQATVLDVADAVWDEVLTGATHNVASSAGRRLRQVAAPVIIDGAVVSSTTNTITFDGDASTTDGAYDPSLIFIATGPGAGQCRLILDYAGSTKTATVDRGWRVNPTNASTYVIMGDAGREHVNEGLATGGGASTITLNASASSQDNAYIGQRVFIRSGTGEDQARRVSTYNGTTKVATVSRAWDIVPDATSAYVMLPTGAIADSDIAGAVWGALIASYTGAGTTGEALDDVHVYSPGAGANTVTVTVTGNSLPLEGASVRLTKGAESYALPTNASGVVAFTLDAGTYTLAASLGGWSYTSSSVVVDGVETVAVAMTQVVVPAPTEPDTCVVYLYARDQHGSAASGVAVQFRLETVSTLTGSAFDGDAHTVTSAADGLVQIQLPQGAWAAILDTHTAWRRFRVPAAASYELPSIIV